MQTHPFNENFHKKTTENAQEPSGQIPDRIQFECRIPNRPTQNPVVETRLPIAKTLKGESRKDG
ncbi:hypothetical protein FHS27_001521 [Rhodopirellula rubra]|uniref:Uncharacterized protein n=1 Tax=Aporhodopirellula rubra TaxID=980271 RepID=A0A7W5H3W8_9BACT|nr:hypothetical protein [Aporhodopirellula rubra]